MKSRFWLVAVTCVVCLGFSACVSSNANDYASQYDYYVSHGGLHGNYDSPTEKDTGCSLLFYFEDEKDSESLEGAVGIAGAYADGAMSARVGPLYRLDSGATVLAVTLKAPKNINDGALNKLIGESITASHFSGNGPYSGLFLLDDDEVFEPLVVGEQKVGWMAQDPSVQEQFDSDSSSYDDSEIQSCGVTESVLVPFPQVDGSDRVGVSVGLIGFAGDVPVVPISGAPDNIQQVAAKMEPTLNLENSLHSAYIQRSESPGLAIDFDGGSLGVTLAADKLFDQGQWDLKPESGKMLDRLSMALLSREPGEVEIVGHTDDVPDLNVGNQVLSENRAVAVKEALEQRPELAGFSFVASGKGYGEPLKAGRKLELQRAQNRRVSVVLKTPLKQDILNDRGMFGPSPDPIGPESTWPDSVVANLDSENVKISASRAISYPNYTVVTYTVTRSSDKSFSLYMDEGERKIPRSEWSDRVTSFFGANIIRGDSRTLPLSFACSDDGRLYSCFLSGSSIYVMHSYKAGDQLTIPVIYPATNDKTISIDVDYVVDGDRYEENGWRINDIPVIPAQDIKK